MRLANDPIAVAVGTQMTAGWKVPDDKEVTLGLLHSLVQHFMHIAAINDYLSLGAHIVLKFGDLLGGVADELLLPLGNDMEPRVRTFPPRR